MNRPVILYRAQMAALLLTAACGNNAIAVLPVADAGFNKQVAVGGDVTLDGSGSLTPPGLTPHYAWELVSMPAASAASIRDPQSAQPSLLVDTVGQFVVALRVAAAGRWSDPDIVVIEGLNRAPIVAVNCGATAPCEVAHGRTGQLNGGLSYDPDGDMLSFVWQQITDAGACSSRCPQLDNCQASDTPAAINAPSARTTTFTAPQVSSALLIFELTANDGYDSARACLAYAVYNDAPLFASELSASPAQPIEGQAVRLRSGAVTDAQGDELALRWSQSAGDVPLQLPTGWLDLAPGTPAQIDLIAPQVTQDSVVEVLLEVTDGVDSTSSSITLTILNSP